MQGQDHAARPEERKELAQLSVQGQPPYSPLQFLHVFNKLIESALTCTTSPDNTLAFLTTLYYFEQMQRAASHR